MDSLTPLIFPFSFSAYNKKEQKYYRYTARLMEKTELKKVCEFIYYTFCGLDVIGESDRDMFREIKDLNERTAKILEFLKKKKVIIKYRVYSKRVRQMIS